MDNHFPNQQQGREALEQWQRAIKQNIFVINPSFQHTVAYYFPESFAEFNSELSAFGQVVPEQIEPALQVNHEALNLPKIEKYNKLGETIDHVVHHPNYAAIGDLIYQTKLLRYFSETGGITKAMMFAYLSAHAGEAGHNCPLACSAGIIRVLKKYPETTNSAYYLEKLTIPSYTQGFSGAQFLTEIQGGSDLNVNDVEAILDAEGGHYKIYGEKWFCSNANADVFLLTARVNKAIQGTKGLGLFLVPAYIEDNSNHFDMHRLKNKVGTQTLATAEITFNGAIAYPVGPVKDGIKIVLENVLNISRIFNAVITTGMVQRAWQIAKSYSQHRSAFGNIIDQYPLVQENLARIKAENLALTASVFATVKMQDEVDLGNISDPKQILLLRLLINGNKYLTALWAFDHIHHAIDVLAGNGTIETFSSLPQLLRDCIICENWEGTHNTLRMQVLRDMHKYQVDASFCEMVQQECDKLKDNEYLAPIEYAFSALKKLLDRLKQADENAQTLIVKDVIDQMMKIYCAICLLKEGIHQQQHDNKDIKLQALKLFSHLHLQQQDIDYLQLIKVLSE